MFKSLLWDRKLIVLLAATLLIKLFSLRADWVENYYTFGVYPVISKLLRSVFGWIPFSVGDLLYIAASIWLAFKLWRLIQLLRRRQLKQHLSVLLFAKYFKLVLLIYIVFNLFWGLNYYRQGSQKQLTITVEPYSNEDLFTLTTILQERLNGYAEKVDSLERLRYDENGLLFTKGQEAYKVAVLKYPFLSYSPASIKPSMLSAIGHWFGFTGYYNPFSAEAQLKTSIPVFLKPFVIAHEMAHQLGYAKENEASFIAFLTCKSSTDIYFLYSAYFEMYRDGLYSAINPATIKLATTYFSNQHPRVTKDMLELRRYNARNKNFIEPFMSSAYDKYLKLNNQPKGKATYNEVIAYLIAYMKKYGKEAI